MRRSKCPCDLCYAKRLVQRRRLHGGSISEFGQRDTPATRLTRNAARVQRQALMSVLTKAKKQNELSSDADHDSSEDFFESTLAGTSMAAKAGKSRQALRNIAAFAGRAYVASHRRMTRE